MSAEIKDYHGTPTLFLDGKPVFDGLMWGSPPTAEGYALKECAKYYGQAGIHLFTFDMGTSGSPADWCGPKADIDGDYDFSLLEKRFGFVLDADPEARFHLRVHLEAPVWWQKLHPDECELTSTGKRLCQSFASQIWRSQAKDYLRALIHHIKSIGMEDRVIAYQTGAGGTGEWVKGAAMAAETIDYSQPMVNHFRAWLIRAYQNDEDLLKSAWHNPNVTFATAQSQMLKHN